MRRSFLIVAVFVVFSGSSAYSMPQVQEVVSAKGIKAWLVEDHALPLVSMRFSFGGGLETDPEDKQGLATLTASLLTQGAGPYDAKAFQDRLAAASIQLSFHAGRDAMGGSLKTLAGAQNEAFRLLSLALAEPRFAQVDFARARDRQRVSQRFQIADPEWQARRALFDLLFGAHPYGFRALGTKQSVLSLTRDDAVSFAKERFVRKNLLISVVGDITAAELRRALDETFGVLPAESTSADVSEVVWPEETKTVCVSRKGEQTSFFFAGPMLPREHPDWYAALVANYILGGGGFESRLMKALRSREGMTYGVSTGLAPMDKASMIAGGFATDRTKAAEARTLVLDVWRDFFENGAEAREVEAAKAYLIGSWPLNMTSRDAVAATLLSLQQDKLGPEYMEKRREFLQNVTTEDVRRVVRERFDPAKLSIAAVAAEEHAFCDLTLNEAEE